MEKPELSPSTLIFKQNRRRQTPITPMPPLQIRTTHNTLVQLHQNKHTTKGHGFVDGSGGGREVHSHITIEQTVFKLILTRKKLLCQTSVTAPPRVGCVVWSSLWSVCKFVVVPYVDAVVAVTVMRVLLHLVWALPILWEVCLCLGCGRVREEWVWGLNQGLEGWWYVCVRCLHLIPHQLNLTNTAFSISVILFCLNHLLHPLSQPPAEYFVFPTFVFGMVHFPYTD